MDSDTTTSPTAQTRLTPSSGTTPPPIGLSAASVPISVSSASAAAVPAGEARLSYKFQRLRERLREAIASGELHGKLPGERQLAKKFRVNAKTLSKALTDLAAEGLLDRSIGRGTFVKGAVAVEAAESTPKSKWLIFADQEAFESPLIAAIKLTNPDVQVIHDTSALRPSFLNQFTAVIDMASQAHEAFLRDMIVRNLT